METAVLIDSREQYTSLLVQCICDPVFDAFMEMYDTARQADARTPLITFQGLMKEIKGWGAENVRRATSAVTDQLPFPLDGLLSAVFLTNVRLLVGVAPSTEPRVPHVETFVFQLFNNCARVFYRTPHLFVRDVSTAELDRNVQTAYAVIARCVNETIRMNMPYTELLDAYLTGLGAMAEGAAPGAADKPLPVAAPVPMAAPVPEPVAEPVAVPPPAMVTPFEVTDTHARADREASDASDDEEAGESTKHVRMGQLLSDAESDD